MLTLSVDSNPAAAIPLPGCAGASSATAANSAAVSSDIFSQSSDDSYLQPKPMDWTIVSGLHPNRSVNSRRPDGAISKRQKQSCTGDDEYNRLHESGGLSK